jgi:pimeloyl-ACP methyl ester carboxylesterase
VPQTRYAPCGELSLAYQVFGEGAVDLVIASSFVSHLELFWTIPEAKAWWDQLASFCRVLLFDKAGVGLSDPVPRVRSIDDRAAEIEAVMNAAGFDSAAVMGLSEGARPRSCSRQRDLIGSTRSYSPAHLPLPQ